MLTTEIYTVAIILLQPYILDLYISHQSGLEHVQTLSTGLRVALPIMSNIV